MAWHTNTHKHTQTHSLTHTLLCEQSIVLHDSFIHTEVAVFCHFFFFVCESWAASSVAFVGCFLRHFVSQTMGFPHSHTRTPAHTQHAHKYLCVRSAFTPTPGDISFVATLASFKGISVVDASPSPASPPLPEIPTSISFYFVLFFRFLRPA